MPLKSLISEVEDVFGEESLSNMEEAQQETKIIYHIDEEETPYLVKLCIYLFTILILYK